MKEKIVKKKITDKKKNDDKNKKKENKFKSDIIIIHHHYAFNSALNMNVLLKALKKITDLMPFVKALINSKITINKVITSSLFWKIIVDSEVTGHIFFNKSFIFNFKPILFYVEMGSGELLWCPDHSKVKIDLKDPNSNIDVVMKDIIWCPNLNHNLLSTISLN